MFYDVFSSLCAKQGISKSKVLLDLDISKSNNTAWKTGRNQPSNEMLKKLADYFGVSIEYLRENEDIKKEPIQTTDRFSEMFYRLDNDDRQEIIDIMNLKLSKSKYQKENVG